MSISIAIGNALSGLQAAGRGISVVSNNISNTQTEGFGRRELELGAQSQTTGGGVRVTSVQRLMDEIVLGDRREADAEFARADTQAAFLRTVQTALGEPGQPGALTELVLELESAIVSAAAQPESQNRQQQVVDRLNQLVDRTIEITDTVQRERARADRDIAQAVGDLNFLLSRVEELNEDISLATLQGDASTGLLDERQQLIDRVAELVPVQEIDRGLGRVALLTDSGFLLDGSAPTLEFQQANLITPYLSYPATLGGITVDGREIDLERTRHLLSGGKLEGLVEVRDTLGPQVQQRLDGFAQDLIERFSEPGVDPTLAAGAPGLLTDLGGAYDPANLVGLSSRLQVNPAVDPDQGGAVFRIRDGIGAVAPGDTGDARQLQRLTDAMRALRVPTETSFGAGAQTASTLAGEVLTAVGGELDLAETDASYAATRAEGLDVRLKQDGVDTDAELQKLLLYENAYSANARVIQTAQVMLDTLLEI